MTYEPDDSPRWLTHWIETAVIAGASLVDEIGGPLSIVIAQTVARAREHVAEAGAAAVREAGDPELLLRRIQEDERLGQMMVAAGEAASRTTLRAKRIVLGRAVGKAARDGAAIDESELTVAILLDLDAPHFQAMAHVWEATSHLDDGQTKVAAATGVLSRYPSPIRAALERHGLLHTVTAYEGHSLIAGLNDFGVSLLLDVRNAAGEADGQDPPS